MQKTYSQKKYFIKTYGCQANVADSGTMAGMLEAVGFEKTDSLENADVFIVNTCSVRQKSEDKVYGLGKDIKTLHDKGYKKPFTIISGCMVGSVTGTRQRYEFEELRKKTSWADAYINPSQLSELPVILLGHKVLDDWAVSKINNDYTFGKQSNKTQAFVNISYGCDNFCTFCVVPYARGKEISRSESEILKEIKHLTQRGYKQVMLCGQNVNSWGLDATEKFSIRTGSNQKLPFAELLRKVAALEEIEKIDFISSNPFDFTQDLIDVLKTPKISNYLHIAVQSGNNEVLKKMNRRHTIEEFYTLIEKIKLVKPNIELGTDIIVGFPGETEEQFEDTVKLFEKITFNVAFISIYSPRKGTPAEKFYKDDIPLKEKRRRHERLTKIWKSSKVRKEK